MDSLSWVTLALAITTLFLGVAAFLSIWQTKKSQERRHREALLNDVLQWAIDIAEVSAGAKATYPPGISLTPEVWRDMDSVNLPKRYRPMAIRAGYAIEAASAFGEDLRSSVAQLCRSLLKVEVVIIKHLEDRASQDELSKSQVALYDQALETIDKVAQMKCKAVG